MGAAVVVAYAEVTLVSGKTADGVRMGEAIEAIRRERGLTQQQVADALGLKLSTYLSYRRGYIQIRPTPAILQKWAGALDISVVSFARRLQIPLLTDESFDRDGTGADGQSSGLEAEISASGSPPSKVRMLAEFIRKYPNMTPDQRRMVDALVESIARLGEET